MFIATLIAIDRLTRADLSRAEQRLAEAGVVVQPATWLDEGSAADIRFSGDASMALQALENTLRHLDAIVQPEAVRRKKLLVADMDSTMITVECIDELADFVGLKAQVAEITERAMQGELDFAAALDARVALLAGLEEGAIDRCRAECVQLMPGARTLVQTMRAHGAHTVLVSGGFTRFAHPVGSEIGFDRVLANVLEIEAGRLTGKVLRPIVDADVKRRTLEAAIQDLGLVRQDVLAVGDGANDIPMLQAAGLGIAFHAKPKAQAAAHGRVNVNDLTALLYAQGIPRAEWVS